MATKTTKKPTKPTKPTMVAKPKAAAKPKAVLKSTKAWPLTKPKALKPGNAKKVVKPANASQPRQMGAPVPETEEEYEAFMAIIRAQRDEVNRATKSGKYAEE